MTLYQLLMALVVGLASGMISYLTASGMSLIISGMGTINFGQGAFYILGAMLCYYSVRANVPFIAALLIGFLVPAAIGALVEFLLRPVYGLVGQHGPRNAGSPDAEQCRSHCQHEHCIPCLLRLYHCLCRTNRAGAQAHVQQNQAGHLLPRYHQ